MVGPVLHVTNSQAVIDAGNTAVHVSVDGDLLMPTAVGQCGHF